MEWLHTVGLIEDKIFDTVKRYIKEESQLIPPSNP
jgi:hypothetical protein